MTPTHILSYPSFKLTFHIVTMWQPVLNHMSHLDVVVTLNTLYHIFPDLLMYPHNTMPSSMAFLVSILLLLYNGSQALPVYHESRTPNETALSKRTLASITWSCILTIFICAWTSVHPNVPPQNQSQALLRRIKLMFWTIISPELVLAWAVRQWFAAREVRDCYNKVNGKSNLDDGEIH